MLDIIQTYIHLRSESDFFVFDPYNKEIPPVVRKKPIKLPLH